MHWFFSSWATGPQDTSDMSHYLRKETGSENRAGKLLKTFPGLSSYATCDGFSDTFRIVKSHCNGPS
jgi:hypothetical protein